MSTHASISRQPSPTRQAASSTTAASKAWKGKTRQIFREGTSADIAAALADLEANREFTSDPDEYEPDDEDAENAEAMDCEIDLVDEDGAHLEDSEADPREFIGLARHPGEAFVSDQNSVREFFDLELRVRGGNCLLLRPHWARGESLGGVGSQGVDELGVRLGTLEAVGEWLERERREFLDGPEPLALGVDALREMELGLPSVSPSAFLRLSGIDKTMTALSGQGHKKESDVKSLFSRYIGGCHLVWVDGSLPLAFLFGLEARKAWVASAVRQAVGRSGRPLTNERLEKCKSISVPKSTKEKESLLGMSAASLSLPDLIRKANLMVGTKWSEVVADYFSSPVQADIGKSANQQ